MTSRENQELLACNLRHGGHAGGQEQIKLSWKFCEFFLFWPPIWPLCHVVASQQYVQGTHV